MRTTWTRAALIVLCVAFHAPTGRGLKRGGSSKTAPANETISKSTGGNYSLAEGPKLG